MRLRAAFLLALSPALGATALAQQPTDIEYREPDLDEDRKLDFNAMFESQWHEYANLDFRPLDESSDQAILDSDDRNGFAFTGISLNLGYNHDETTRLVVGASHRGLWGNDSVGSINAFGGWLYFTALYAEFQPIEGDAPPKFRIGRQYFSIGGTPGPEFVLADIVDAVRIDQPLPGIGRLILLPIEVPSVSSSYDHADFVSFIGQSDIQSFNFRGDTMTRRHGLVLALDELADDLDVRAYGFYSDLGALGTGSDISYNGALGNFSDNDWVANFGVRGSYDTGALTPWVAVDGSTGIDRKELVASDANTTGLSWQVGLDLSTGDEDAGLRAQAYYFDAFGPSYRSNGLIYSHGYVGMKGQQVGGTLANRFMGWHPTSYVGLFGVSDNPQDTSRKSGTRVLHGRVGYEFPKRLELSASYWFLQDTGISSVDFDKLEELTPPFGYAREEFAAEERLGGVLGHELDLDLDLRATDTVAFHLNGALILPGAFYAQEIARVAGTALGSDDPAMPWALNAGMRVRFQ